MVIPATRLNGEPIVSIAAQTFMNAGLTSLTLNEGLKSIKTNAFRHNNLTSLTIPESVTEIKNSAFADNQFVSVTFLGAKPTAPEMIGLDNQNNPLLTGSIKVPLVYFHSYRASAYSLGVLSTHFGVIPSDTNLEGGLGYR